MALPEPADAARSLPTPFLTKTYQLVDDGAIDDIISWNEDGSTFVVWNPSEFARDLLPKYFKHNNFSSFVRQLNTYGFRKVVPDRWEFSNEHFRRGEKRLLSDIQRRKLANLTVTASPPPAAAVTIVSPSPVVPVWTTLTDSGDEQAISSNSSPVNAPRDSNNCSNTELIGENEKLKRENMQLNNELSKMKKLCNNIYVMMSSYGGDDKNRGESSCKPLDLMPLKRLCDDRTAENGRNEVEDEERLRLFGVAIGNKRVKESEQVVKCEPLDEEDNSGEGVDNQDKRWVGSRSISFDLE